MTRLIRPALGDGVSVRQVPAVRIEQSGRYFIRARVPIGEQLVVTKGIDGGEIIWAQYQHEPGPMVVRFIADLAVGETLRLQDEWGSLDIERLGD